MARAPKIHFIVVPPVIMAVAPVVLRALAMERHRREQPVCLVVIYRRERLFLMARAVASTPEIVIINKKSRGTRDFFCTRYRTFVIARRSQSKPVN